MAHLLSQTRELAISLFRPMCSTNSRLMLSLLKESAIPSLVLPRVCHKQTYCTTTRARTILQLTEEERQLGKAKSMENEATRTLENLNEGERIKLKRLKMEYENLKAEMEMVPREMRNLDWVKLLNLDTTSSRMKYFRYRTLTENKELSRRKKKEHKRLAKESTKQDAEDEDKGLNKIVHHIESKFLFKYVGKLNACRSMVFGNPFVFDFNVGEQREREARNLIQQLDACYSANKRHIEPFHMHFTGIPNTGFLADELKWKHTGNAFIDYHEQDIHEVFPKEQLVYLTPQSFTNLDYNPNDIYVMGALVDLIDKKPYTSAKAKKLNLRTACLPLNRFYRLKKNKSLPLDIVYRVMLDINLTGDWEKAMIHVPQRYWVDVKTPKLRLYWEEKYEEERAIKEASERHKQEMNDRETEDEDMDIRQHLHTQ